MSVKGLLFGRPIPTSRAGHHKLGVVRALSTFCADALSSSLYAFQAVMVVLMEAGSTGLQYAIPIAAITAGLLVVVVVSYRQTIDAYPGGGGGYTVATKNLGSIAGLMSAWSLLANYVLTVAVSISAGVAAINSLLVNAQLPALHSSNLVLDLLLQRLFEPGPTLMLQPVPASLLALVVITLLNRRGVSDSATAFVIFTYSWLGLMVFTLGWGMLRLMLYGPSSFPPPTHVDVEQTGVLTTFLLLRAFSGGCSLLTGTEAISNGVPNVKEPSQKNSKLTLAIMAGFSIFMSMSIATLTKNIGIFPNEATGETLVSQIGRAVLGVGTLYNAYQITGALILAIASVTAFVDFPRLSMLMSMDGFLPHAFRNLGDRLVYSAGIWTLALFSGLIIVQYHAHEGNMLPLYAVGGFACFTLSQCGMVVHHFRNGKPGWGWSALINGIGMIACAAVLYVLLRTKWADGAYLVVYGVGIGMLFSLGIHRHYRNVAKVMSLNGKQVVLSVRPKYWVVFLEGVNKLSQRMVEEAMAAGVEWIPVHFESENTAEVKDRWVRYGFQAQTGKELVIRKNEFRDITGPSQKLVKELLDTHKTHTIVVVLGRLYSQSWWKRLLHGGTDRVLENTLATMGDRVAIAEIPLSIDRHWWWPF